MPKTLTMRVDDTTYETFVRAPRPSAALSPI